MKKLRWLGLKPDSRRIVEKLWKVAGIRSVYTLRNPLHNPDDKEEMLNLNIKFSRSGLHIVAPGNEVEKQIERSRELWGNLDRETHEVLRRLVLSGLEYLYVNVDKWLTSALVEGSDLKTLHIQMGLMMMELESALVSKVDRAKFEAKHTQRQIMEILEESPEMNDEEFVAYVAECLNLGSPLTLKESKRLLSMLD